MWRAASDTKRNGCNGITVMAPDPKMQGRVEKCWKSIHRSQTKQQLYILFIWLAFLVENKASWNYTWLGAETFLISWRSSPWSALKHVAGVGF